MVSTEQLRRLGYSRSAIGRASSSGRLHLVHRGVYAVGHRRLTSHGRLMAAVLACSPAVASHTTAAGLLGLLRGRPEAVHLSTRSPRRSKPDFVLHRATLDRVDLIRIDGIPATALPRTLLDLAAMLSPKRLERALERAEELKLFDLGPVDEIFKRCAHHRGVVPLRRALELYRPDPAFTRSGLERLFLKLIREAGLPLPAANYTVAGYELDMYWEQQRVAVELDTYGTHGSQAAFQRDRARDLKLKLIGIEIVRVTDLQLALEPESVMRDLRDLLELG